MVHLGGYQYHCSTLVWKMQSNVNISLFINTLTHNMQQKPASVSYCPPRHDLLFPASLTWPALRVFLSPSPSSLQPQQRLWRPNFSSESMLGEVHQNMEKAKNGEWKRDSKKSEATLKSAARWICESDWSTTQRDTNWFPEMHDRRVDTKEMQRRKDVQLNKE